jgi:D-amino peptidase
VKVYISADIEGIASVVDLDQLSSGGPDYARVRRLMTQEVNAAVEGAFAAGAIEVVVSDGHGAGKNLIPEELHEDAYLIAGPLKPVAQMEGIDDTFSAAIFIGYHARMGSAGILSHTMNGVTVSEIRVNGVTLGETGINAAIAGAHGVPVVLVTGDAAVCREAVSTLGHVDTVAVKQAVSYCAAKCIHPKKAQRLIREAAEKALKNRASFRPFRFDGPVTIDVVFRGSAACDFAARLPECERVNDVTLRHVAPCYLEGFKWMRAMFAMGG